MFLSTLFLAALAMPLQLQVQQASAVPAIHPGHGFAVLYRVVGSHNGDSLGKAVCALPDLDADGVQDLLIGLPNRDTPWSTIGRAWVVSGVDGELLREHLGWNYGDRFGRTVSLFPDLDHDGVADYAVGATWAIDPLMNPEVDHPGSATFFSGATGEQLEALGGVVSGECFGGGLANLNDVSGDGQPDFAIGSRFGGAIDSDPLTAPGKVRIFSGATLQAVHEISGSYPGDFLAGEATIPIGDLDGDGAVDVVAGAWAYPNNAAQGQVFVISSASGTVIRTLEGEREGDRFGWALAALPDVDGDALPDLLVGAPYAGTTSQGRVYVISAGTGAVLKVIEGKQAGEQFGSALAGVGDRNGDGVVDYVIGAPGHAQSRGRADLVSGATGTVLASVAGSGTGEQFGFTVTSLPDLDGDGRTEIGVSATQWPVLAAYGRLTVFTYGK